MNTLRGNQLNESDKAHVLSAYVYRKTVENMARNAAAVRTAGNRLPPITDAQWLAITDFAVTQSGRLDKRSRHCMTHDCEIPERKAIIEALASSRAVAA